jgi:hypothetical protein
MPRCQHRKTSLVPLSFLAATVMARHSRRKDGVASLAYARPSRQGGHTAHLSGMPGTRPGMTEQNAYPPRSFASSLRPR